MLEKLSALHAVVTGVALIRLPDAERLTSSSPRWSISPRSLRKKSPATFHRRAHDKAGGYAIQGRAGRYIPRIEGCSSTLSACPLASPPRLIALGWSED